MSSWYDWMVCAASRERPGISASEYCTQRERDGGDDGPGQRARAADDGHGDERDRGGEREQARRDEPDHAGVERAGEPRHERAHHERADLDADDVDAARLRAQLAAVQGAHRPPGPQRSDVVGHQHGDADAAPHQPVERRGRAELDRADGRERDAGEPVHAAGDGLGLDERQRHEQAEAERGHGEVVALQPQARDGQDEAAESRHGAGGREAEQPRPVQLHGAVGAGVGAEAHEGGVPQRDLPGVAEQQREADHDQRVDAAEREHLEQEAVADDERHDERHGHRDEGRERPERARVH